MLFPGRLEEWINRNTIKFSRDKHQAPPWAPGQAETAGGIALWKRPGLGSELGMCVPQTSTCSLLPTEPLPTECLVEVN